MAYQHVCSQPRLFVFLKILPNSISFREMDSSIFEIEQILKLESPKVESIAYSGILPLLLLYCIVGSDPNDIRVFVAIKGGRLYEYFIQAESRNEKHTVLCRYADITLRNVPTQSQIQYPQ